MLKQESGEITFKEEERLVGLYIEMARLFLPGRIRSDIRRRRRGRRDWQLSRSTIPARPNFACYGKRPSLSNFAMVISSDGYVWCGGYTQDAWPRESSQQPPGQHGRESMAACRRGSSMKTENKPSINMVTSFRSPDGCDAGCRAAASAFRAKRA